MRVTLMLTGLMLTGTVISACVSGTQSSSGETPSDSTSLPACASGDLDDGAIAEEKPPEKPSISSEGQTILKVGGGRQAEAPMPFGGHPHGGWDSGVAALTVPAQQDRD